ncbi:hypothetical protein LXL04_015984 [Taraxacum kok-saghyz]
MTNTIEIPFSDVDDDDFQTPKCETRMLNLIFNVYIYNSQYVKLDKKHNKKLKLLLTSEAETKGQQRNKIEEAYSNLIPLLHSYKIPPPSSSVPKRNCSCFLSPASSFTEHGVRTLIENGVKSRYRSMFVIIGDKSRDHSWLNVSSQASSVPPFAPPNHRLPEGSATPMASDLAAKAKEGIRLLAGSESLARSLKQTVVDNDNISFLDAAKSVGYAKTDDFSNVFLDERSYSAFVELHIEQGPILENEGIFIGIVTAIAAPASIKVDFGGNGGHAGAVLMPQRSNMSKDQMELEEMERVDTTEADVQVMENGDVEMSKFKDGNHIYMGATTECLLCYFEVEQALPIVKPILDNKLIMLILHLSAMVPVHNPCYRFYYGSVTTEFATESFLRILQRKDSYGFYNGSVPTDFATEYIGYRIKSFLPLPVHHTELFLPLPVHHTELDINIGLPTYALLSVPGFSNPRLKRLLVNHRLVGIGWSLLIDYDLERERGEQKPNRKPIPYRKPQKPRPQNRKKPQPHNRNRKVMVRCGFR